jgi:CheY-like chemotaxis protein
METDAPAILIVDDNEDNRYTLQLLLESDVIHDWRPPRAGTRRSRCSHEKNLAWSFSI